MKKVRYKDYSGGMDMPIEGIKQPNYIEINSELRLRAYDGYFDFAFEWYQDIESLELIDGKGKAIPYTYERLKKMYEYLNERGEVYFIEKNNENKYVPIGDVTFWELDMPIVISKEYRSQGIGSKVIQCLIERARILGYERIRVNEIYDYNIGSQRLFESCGFMKENSKENGASYFIDLKE